MSLEEAVSSVGGAFTSPAKLAFVAYAALAYSGHLPTSRVEFAMVVGIFIVVQVVHDDYLRIVLNRLAVKHSSRIAATR